MMKKILYVIGFCLISLVAISQDAVEKTSLTGNVFVTRGILFDNPTVVQETYIDKGNYCLVTYIEDVTGKRYNFPTILDFSVYNEARAIKQREELLKQYNIILPSKKI